jgi:cyclopropane-fatty-acyl-phospholipid synthase
MSQKLSFFQKISRKFVFKLLKEIQEGHISLQDQKLQFEAGLAAQPCDLSSNVTVLTPKVYPRIIQRGSIGASESFMLGEWTTQDLVTLLRIFIRNRNQLFQIDKGWVKFQQVFWRLLDLYKRNTPEQSRLNISAHYDLGNEFFKLFLDHSLMYSSALFLSPTDDLETASEQKLHRICKEFNLQPHHRVIEIGTGWGGFAIYAAKNYGCHVTTTTISTEQYHFAQKKIAELGLTHQITLLQEDYRSLTGQYDRLVSIEMIEAVGYEFMPTFIRKCNHLLKADGMALIQAIIRPDQKYHAVHKEVDFIKKYIFPGGCLPSTLFLLEEAAKHSDLRLFDLKDMGYDYAKTLSAWRKRFMEQIPVIKNLGFNDDFIRMWIFYLAYCEAGFLERYISVVQLAFVKPRYELV